MERIQKKKKTSQPLCEFLRRHITMSCFNECQTYCLPLRFFSNYQIDYNKTELCGNVFVAKSEALT